MSTVTLYPYQKEVVGWMHNTINRGYKGGVVAMLMGLGKTVVTLEYLRQTLTDPNAVALVCAPKSVIVAWFKIQSELFDGCFDFKQAKRREDLLYDIFTPGPARTTPRVYIMTTDQFIKLRDEDFRWMQTVVIDEAHVFCNSKSKRSQWLSDVSRYMSRLWLLSGTPVRNESADMRQLLHTLITYTPWDPDWTMPFGLDFKYPDPRRAFAVPKDFMILVKAVSYADAGVELPSLTVKVHENKLTAAEELAYRVASTHPHPLGRTTYQRNALLLPGRTTRSMAKTLIEDDGVAAQLAGLLPEDREGGKTSSKVMTTAQILLDHPDEPIVVFSTSKIVLGNLETYMVTLGETRPIYMINGGVGLGARCDILKQWEAGGGLLFMTLKTGGEGLTLTSSCRCIHMDQWWSPAATDQATARIWRLGQTQPVSVHVLWARNTVEDLAVNYCHRKSELYGQMLGNGFKWTQGDDPLTQSIAAHNSAAASHRRVPLPVSAPAQLMSDQAVTDALHEGCDM